MLREAGAVEVHVRIASPPVKWPCFYGIDFATPAELIANAAATGRRGGDARRVRRAVGADTLGYISYQAWSRPPTARIAAVLGLLRRRVPDRAAR
jgi:amidophosphoribosyltransferase